MFRLRVAILLFCACLLAAAPRYARAARQSSASPAPPQASNTLSPEAAMGIGLYQRGDAKGAVKALRSAVKKNKQDAEAWHFLGLALHLEGDLKDALKAFDKAIELRPDYAPSHSAQAYTSFLSGNFNAAEKKAQRALELDPRSPTAHLVVGLVHLRRESFQKAVESAEAALKSNPDYAAAHFLKSQALSELYWRGEMILADQARGASPLSQEAVKEMRESQQKRLEEAADSLAAYLRLNPKDPEADIWREQLKTLRTYARQMKERDTAQPIYSINDVVQKATIISKPEPAYTEEARLAGISGVVRLRLVLGFDGRVHNIAVMRSLSHGLTEKAIRAARNIKFIPAMKNGVPVSQYVMVEYNFNVY